MAGRPTLLTPELQDAICAAIRRGMYAVRACALVGVSKTSFYAWKTRGDAGEEPYADFLAAVTQAEAEFQEASLECIAAAAKPLVAEDGKLVAAGDWRALSWVMERRFPDDYGKRVRQDVTVQAVPEVVLSDPSRVPSGVVEDDE